MADTEEKIFRYKKYLERYQDSKSHEKEVYKLLKKLDDLPVTLDHLQSTGIGKTVNGYRKHEGDISAKAKSIVSKWKRLVPIRVEPPSVSSTSLQCETISETSYSGGMPEVKQEKHSPSPNTQRAPYLQSTRVQRLESCESVESEKASVATRSPDDRVNSDCDTIEGDSVNCDKNVKCDNSDRDTDTKVRHVKSSDHRSSKSDGKSSIHKYDRTKDFLEKSSKDREIKLKEQKHESRKDNSSHKRKESDPYKEETKSKSHSSSSGKDSRSHEYKSHGTSSKENRANADSNGSSQMNEYSSKSSSSSKTKNHSHSSSKTKDYSHSSNKTKDHTHSSSEMKDHSSGSSKTKDHSHSSSKTKDYSHSSSKTKDHTRSSSEMKDHSSGSSKTKDHSHSSSKTKDHSHSSSKTKDHSHNSSKTKEHSHSSSKTKEHSRISSPTKEHSSSAGHIKKDSSSSSLTKEHSSGSDRRKEHSTDSKRLKEHHSSDSKESMLKEHSKRDKKESHVQVDSSKDKIQKKISNGYSEDNRSKGHSSSSNRSKEQSSSSSHSRSSIQTKKPSHTQHSSGKDQRRSKEKEQLVSSSRDNRQKEHKSSSSREKSPKECISSSSNTGKEHKSSPILTDDETAKDVKEESDSFTIKLKMFSEQIKAQNQSSHCFPEFDDLPNGEDGTNDVYSQLGEQPGYSPTALDGMMQDMMRESKRTEHKPKHASRSAKPDSLEKHISSKRKADAVIEKSPKKKVKLADYSKSSSKRKVEEEDEDDGPSLSLEDLMSYDKLLVNKHKKKKHNTVESSTVQKSKSSEKLDKSSGDSKHHRSSHSEKTSSDKHRSSDSKSHGHSDKSSTDKHGHKHSSKSSKSSSSQSKSSSESKKSSSKDDSSSTSRGSSSQTGVKRKATEIDIPAAPSKVKLSTADIMSGLPETSPNYHPLPYLKSEDRDRHAAKDEGEYLGTKPRNTRTLVYSGKKANFLQEVPKLFDACIRILCDNIDSLENVGGVPSEILKPVLEKCSPSQLYTIEEFNPNFIGETEDLWEKLCNKDFKSAKPDNYESWRELYLRKHDEREARLKRLTSNISASFAKKQEPVKKTKLAYVDSFVKPPRGVMRQQRKFGTAGPMSKQDPLARLSSHTNNQARAPINRGHDLGNSSRPQKQTKTISPMMQKSMRLFKNLKR